MRRLALFHLLAVAAAGCVVGMVACSASDEATSGDPSADAGIKGPDAGPTADSGTPVFGTIDANAIVLVHAAAFPAFRICFDKATNDLPQPSVDLLPESNVVGVDVGTAVRLPPHGGTLGNAFVFLESKLRQFYPIGAPGPTCGTLLSSAGQKDLAIPVGEVTADLSSGVHALVLGGCQAAALDPIASQERCGASWNSATGNLSLSTITLTAFTRPADMRLAVQILQLSPALASRAAGRALGLASGALDGGVPTPFVEGVVPFGQAVPNPPALLDVTTADISSYATSGVFVTLGIPIDDAGLPILDAGAGDAEAGAREVVISQSFADIQKLSAPRSLPPDWFAFASSYVVVTVGDTDPRLPDGGRDDDPRRALHLLAIPLASPEEMDAGAAAPGDL